MHTEINLIKLQIYLKAYFFCPLFILSEGCFELAWMCPSVVCTIKEASEHHSPQCQNWLSLCYNLRHYLLSFSPYLMHDSPNIHGAQRAVTYSAWMHSRSWHDQLWIAFTNVRDIFLNFYKVCCFVFLCLGCLYIYLHTNHSIDVRINIYFQQPSLGG